MAKDLKNLAASVRQRLLNLAKQRKEDFNFVLIRYGLERLLYRLSQSSHADTFVLKGAMLFAFWSGGPHRPSKDMDLLGRGEPNIERLVSIFQQIVRIPADDGLLFLPETVVAGAIREDAIYDGVRVTLEARLDAARLPLQVDVGFGDAITPKPQLISYPSLLGMASPKVHAYPREVVIAEKFHAMVDLGLGNSRMKDFFDIWFLARQFEYDGEQLFSAIQATFGRRQTVVPASVPLALSAEFAADRAKQTQWRAFLAKASLTGAAPSLTDLVAELRVFFAPFIAGPTADTGAISRWRPSAGWKSPGQTTG